MDPTQPELPLSLQRALVRYPTDTGRRWLAFTEPIEQFIATNIHEVLPTIDRIDRAAKSGLWLVGMISYDASPAFDSALASQRSEEVPLVAFASFADAQNSRGPAGEHFDIGGWTTSCDQAEYEAAVSDVRRRIAAGDTYQVNFTMRFHADFHGDPEAFFAELSRAQRADHLSYLDFGDAAVCSASPELFLRREGRRVTTRPMKGTRPRHPDPTIDRTYANDLAKSAKDRAENTMIVDMCRNDLGRVADIGSVTTASLHTIETYPTVHQMTSSVSATSDAGLVELLSATFPGASITGAPKVATSRIIEQLESEPRGVYCGAVGAIEPGGDLELNIGIRTAWVDRRNDRVTYAAGGGVIWDSDPSSEWLEALDKARVLHRAAEPFKLLETIAWQPGTGALLLDRHISRLAHSAIHFGFDLDLGEVRRRIGSVTHDRPAMLRLLVASHGAIEIELRDMPEVSGSPVLVSVDSDDVDSGDEFLRHKTTRRSRYDQARARFPQSFDVLLHNERGEITESTIANIVVEIDGRLLTPPADSGLLPGTFRAELIDAERVTEAVLTIQDLERAESLWLINSVRGWIPAELQTTHPEQTRPESTLELHHEGRSR